MQEFFPARKFMKICPNCSAELNDNAKFCSICGAAITGDQKSEEKTAEQTAWEQRAAYSQNGYSRQATDQAYPLSTNGFAIAGFVCAFILPILGIIFSAIAMKQIDERKEGGKGLAVAGLVISIVWIGIMLIILMSGACTVSTLYNYYL